MQETSSSTRCLAGNVLVARIDSGSSAASSEAWIDVVECIETIHTELGHDTLVDREVLLQRKVGIEESRSEGVISACGTNLINACRAETGEWGVLETAISVLNQRCCRSMIEEAPVSDWIVTT